ncbi:hypothetical protein ABTZ57_16015 [Streptomyces sp. NPDC094048]|uniref:hypothetical protein n=1 Tax=Streptomyces sp. NPDC094048 TaxID=3155207 RepID=UPI003327AF77
MTDQLPYPRRATEPDGTVHAARFAPGGFTTACHVYPAPVAERLDASSEQPVTCPGCVEAFARTVGMVEPEKAPAFVAAFRAHVEQQPVPAAPVEEQAAPLTLGDRADHAIGLYARTAVELEDARAENARLQARVAELSATVGTRPVPTFPQITAEAAEPQPEPLHAEAAIYASALLAGADAIEALPEDYECDPGRGDAARLLRRMAGAKEEPAAEQAPPAVGDRYVSRHVSRTVTVTRVWEAEDGHTAVAYEWRDNRPGQCGSACPLDVFRREYRPATEAGR